MSAVVPGPLPATRLRYFAVTAPGLEALLAAELVALGLEAKAVVGGVEGRVSFQGLWTLHLGSALAESVRVRLKEFRARDFATLERELARLPWHAFLQSGSAPTVSVVCHRSRLFHSDAVAERAQRVLDAALKPRGSRAGAPVTPEGQPQTVYLRIERDVVVPSVSASGERLHKRGYRTHVEVAPLRETLAAAMVLLLERLGPVERVWDPFSGSGVLVLEWLQRRSGVLPGARRSFAFEDWPCHPMEGFRAFRETLERPALLGGASLAGVPAAFASDRNPKAIRSLRHNLERADVGPVLDVQVGDFRECVERIPPGTAILSNPPYGIRLGSPRGARRLFQDFEHLLTVRADLRPVLLASSGADLSARSRLPWHTELVTQHGGRPLRLLSLAR